jgi:hypothetical protein
MIPHMIRQTTQTVGFDLDQNQVHSSPLHEDEAKKMWYSSKEVKKLKSQALKHATNEADHHAYSYACVIRGTYQACSDVQENEHEGDVLDKVQTNVLGHWISMHPDMLGLDHYVEGCSRTEHSKAHVKAVLDVQRMDFEGDYKLLLTSIQSHNLSSAARYYAREMARAQANVDLDEEEAARVDSEKESKLHLPSFKTWGNPLRALAKNSRGGVAA